MALRDFGASNSPARREAVPRKARSRDCGARGVPRIRRGVDPARVSGLPGRVSTPEGEIDGFGRASRPARRRARNRLSRSGEPQGPAGSSAVGPGPLSEDVRKGVFHCIDAPWGVSVRRGRSQWVTSANRGAPRENTAMSPLQRRPTGRLYSGFQTDRPFEHTLSDRRRSRSRPGPGADLAGDGALPRRAREGRAGVSRPPLPRSREAARSRRRGREAWRESSRNRAMRGQRTGSRRRSCVSSWFTPLRGCLKSGDPSGTTVETPRGAPPGAVTSAVSPGRPAVAL